MPHRTFDINELAGYLHLDRQEVERLVHDQEIPFQRRGPRLVFRKLDIDAWASKRILGLQGRRLDEFHAKISQPGQTVQPQGALLEQLLRPRYIEPALRAKTKASVLREMAALAEKIGHVLDPKALLEGLSQREEMMSTGVPGGLALLHTRSSESFLYDAPFVLLARTIQQIPFGAPDGRSTDLFFLVASPGPGLHLRVLARICLLAQKTDLLERLRAAPDAEAMHQAVQQCEAEALEA